MVMGRRRRWVFVVACLLTGAGPDVPKAGPAPSDADARLGRILDEWHRKTAAIRTVDVKFRGADRSQHWGDEPFTGRAVLLPAGRALVEMVREGQDGKPRATERVVWTRGEVHQLLHEPKLHRIIERPESVQDRLPAPLALPFLWQASVDGLRSQYDVALLNEAPGSFVLSFTPRTDAGRTWCSKAILELDRTTFLPRKYHVIGPEGRDVRDYHPTEVRVNQPVPNDLLQIPPADGWKVTRTGRGDQSVYRAWFRPTDVLP